MSITELARVFEPHLNNGEVALSLESLVPEADIAVDRVDNSGAQEGSATVITVTGETKAGSMFTLRLFGHRAVDQSNSDLTATITGSWVSGSIKIDCSTSVLSFSDPDLTALTDAAKAMHGTTISVMSDDELGSYIATMHDLWTLGTSAFLAQLRNAPLKIGDTINIDIPGRELQNVTQNFPRVVTTDGSTRRFFTLTASGSEKEQLQVKRISKSQAAKFDDWNEVPAITEAVQQQRFALSDVLYKATNVVVTKQRRQTLSFNGVELSPDLAQLMQVGGKLEFDDADMLDA